MILKFVYYPIMGILPDNTAAWVWEKEIMNSSVRCE
jgi:hypothetical protein